MPIDANKQLIDSYRLIDWFSDHRFPPIVRALRDSVSSNLMKTTELTVKIRPIYL